MEWITSRKNPLLTRIRKLAAGSGRDRRAAGEYLGDGRKLLEEALKWHAPLTTVVVSEGVELPNLPREVRAVQVPRDVMETISPMKTPQGALFLVRLPETEPPEILTGDRYLVLDGVQDPGNVGTIWRTADALGADGLILVGNCADPYSPKVVRSSMGACFRLPVYETDAGGLCALLERSGIPRHRPAGGHGLPGAGAYGPGGGGHWQRGERGLSGTALPQRPDHQDPHAGEVRVPERGGGRRHRPVGDGPEPIK